MDNGHADATTGIRRRASVAGSEVALTASEYELLRVLSLAAGRVVTHDERLRPVWRGGRQDRRERGLRRGMSDRPGAFAATDRRVVRCTT